MTVYEAESTTSVADAVETVAAGGLIALVHGQLTYLVAGGGNLSAEVVREMTTSGRGVLRAAAPSVRLRELGLASREGHCAPVDVAGRDRPEDPAGRAATVRALADPARGEFDFRPGHVFPVAFAVSGSGAGAGAPEAAAGLARLATGVPIAAYCEATDGTWLPSSARRGLPVVSVEAVLADSVRVEPALERLVSVALPTRSGEMSAIAFRSVPDRREYTAFLHGDPGAGRAPVHIQFACQPGDVFGAVTCRCGEMLQDALQRIDASGSGVILHIPHPEPLRHLGRDHRLTLEAAAIERDILELLDCLGVCEAEISCNEELKIDPPRAKGGQIR